MTLPFEEQSAINRTRKFLYNLATTSKKDIVKTPIKDLRREVWSLLHHYPAEYRVDQLFERDEQVEFPSE